MYSVRTNSASHLDTNQIYSPHAEPFFQIRPNYSSPFSLDLAEEFLGQDAVFRAANWHGIGRRSGA